MSIKNKIQKQINKKAKHIREMRVEAASNKTIESIVFDFFKNAEESRLIHDGQKYDAKLISEARISLENRLKLFDKRVKVSIEFNASDDLNKSIVEEAIRGVTIWWGLAYIKANNVDPSLYIDVSRMLLC